MKEFGYSSVMQCPKLTKIVINQGMGQAVADKKLIDVAEAELTQITGQKAVQTRSRKDISNFKLRKGMPIGVRVTLRDTKMYEFLERLIAVVGTGSRSCGCCGRPSAWWWSGRRRREACPPSRR